ncbi:MAG: hypothetical protein AAF851_05360 [Myxococcota bacterium]
MSSRTVRLELEEIRIYRPKKKWRLYFLIDQSVRSRLFVRHTRNKARSAGEVVDGLQREAGGELVDAIPDILATTAAAAVAPWLVLGKAAINTLGAILRRVPDRDLGTISMDEVFESEFHENGELDRENRPLAKVEVVDP